jgi:large conductance mechanosensitive channel
MLQELKEFVTRGNVLMLAVGFIMGVAFQRVVSSMVEDVIMPLVAIPFGEPDFSALNWEINGSVIMWGSFVTAAVIFLLTALAVFVFIVKPYNLLPGAKLGRQAGPGAGNRPVSDRPVDRDPGLAGQRLAT